MGHGRVDKGKVGINDGAWPVVVGFKEGAQCPPPAGDEVFGHLGRNHICRSCGDDVAAEKDATGISFTKIIELVGVFT